MRTSLIVILSVSVVGALLSGLLAWQEWFAQHLSVMGASFGAAGSIYGVPGGFFFCAIFIVLAIVAGARLSSKR